MINDPNNFLNSLIQFVIAAAAAQTPAVTLVLPPASGANIWRNKIVEPIAGTPAPVSILRYYAGPARQFEAQARAAIQCYTLGFDEEAAQARAQALYECFLAATGLPLRMVTINGYKAADQSSDGTWRLVSVDLVQTPGKIGVDDRGRTEVSFNLDVAFCKLT